jgi:hypothetical protein
VKGFMLMFSPLMGIGIFYHLSKAFLHSKLNRLWAHTLGGALEGEIQFIWRRSWSLEELTEFGRFGTYKPYGVSNFSKKQKRSFEVYFCFELFVGWFVRFGVHFECEDAHDCNQT